jgi:hypothetical protein
MELKIRKLQKEELKRELGKIKYLIFLFPFSSPFYPSNRTWNWIQKKAIVKIKEILLSEYPLI